jgi:hypothetical protein
MARDEETTTTPPSGSCKSAAEQLKDIKAEIAAFEARKLADLKSQLEKFVADQEKKVGDYTAKYADLKRRWREQQREIEDVYNSIKNCFPDPNLEKLKSCICKPECVIACLDEKIAGGKKTCRPCEADRDRAQDAFDKASAQLAALVDLAAKLEETLNNNGGKDGENGKGGLIKQIREYIKNPDLRTQAFYLFWFKLLRDHWNIHPDDAGDPKPPALKDYCKDYCTNYNKQNCDNPYKPKSDQGTTTGYGGEDTGGAAPTPQDDPYAACKSLTMTLPRLLPPSSYRGLLDCAFDCYNGSKKRLAEEEAKLKRKYDELDAWIKQRGELAKSLETDIINCLKALPPGDPCCPESDSPRTGA